MTCKPCWEETGITPSRAQRAIKPWFFERCCARQRGTKMRGGGSGDRFFPRAVPRCREPVAVLAGPVISVSGERAGRRKPIMIEWLVGGMAHNPWLTAAALAGVSFGGVFYARRSGLAALVTMGAAVFAGALAWLLLTGAVLVLFWFLHPSAHGPEYL